MSDADCYAKVLSEKFNYTNTFYHCEPRLDIKKPGQRWNGTSDFVISSDVFEHVPPPVQDAFNNLASLLKPGGIVVFSVPFSLETVTREHFPNLCKFELRQETGGWVLQNETSAGVKEEYRNLVFHGGPGATLEMRLFSLSALMSHFKQAGFTDIRVHSEPYFEFGVFWLHPWSLVISALKPY